MLQYQSRKDEERRFRQGPPKGKHEAHERHGDHTRFDHLG